MAPTATTELRLGRFSDSPFERPSLALGNLARLDLGGFTRSLTQPSTLAPIQRQTLADQWGLGDGVFGSLLRIATNPIVLIGLLLHSKFPVVLAKDLFKFGAKLTDLARKPGIIRGRIIGNIDSIFAGLKVSGAKNAQELPEVYKLLLRDVKQFSERHLETMGNSILRYEAAAGAAFDQRIGTALAYRLNGGRLSRSLGRPFDTLVKDVRGSLNTIDQEVFRAGERSVSLRALEETKVKPRFFQELAAKPRENLTTRERAILGAVTRRRAASKRELFEQLRQNDIATGVKIGFIPNYWPHRIPRSAVQDTNLVERLTAASSTEQQFGQQMLGASGRVSTPHVLARHNNMTPDPRDLNLIKDLIPGRDLARFTKEAALGNVPFYSLNFKPTISAYVQSTAKAFGWTVQGHGPKLASAARRLEASGTPGNQVRAAYLRDTFIPAALGRNTYKQTLSAAQFDEMKLNIIGLVAPGGRMRGMVGDQVADFLQRGLTADRGILSLRNIQGRLASHFYLGALGGNPVSSMYNLMQTLLTTIPLIGVKNTVAGITRTFQKVPKYFAARKEGILHDAALKRAFPEFAAEGLAGDPLTQEALGAALSRAWDVAGNLHPNAAAGFYDRAKAGMMAFFRSSELMVRLTAFEGTMAKGLAEGLTVAEVMPIARRVTEATQFLSGPASTPVALANLGPLLRQFGTFPSRYADFLFGTATEVGSAAQAGGMFGLFPNRNLGTLGRAMLTSGIVYETGQEFLDRDLSQGLIFGALPSPPPGSPFGIFPFVPPVVNLAGAAIKAATTGDLTSLRFQAPILFPSGVQLARFSTGLSPGVAQTLGRSFIDYRQPTPDGRFPVYTKDRTLRGFVTPMEYWSSMFGFPPGGASSLQRERELEGFLLSQRDRIRELRRNFLDKMFIKNDVRGATRINEEYKRLYPGLGGIQVRPQDLRAVQLRAMIPRLEKALESLPADQRQQFGEIVSTVLMQEAENLLGVDPLLLRLPTISARDPYRTPPAGTAIERIFQNQQARKLRAASPFKGFNPGGQNPLQRKNTISPGSRSSGGLQF